MNWGERYLDHYESLFGQPSTRAVFESRPGAPCLQILGYQGVFGGGARLYCTLGLTHYAAAVGGPAEVGLAVDDAFEEAQVVLANACFFAADGGLQVGVGTVIGGVGKVAPGLSARWHKEALYLSAPHNLPAGAGQVVLEGQEGRLHMAFFINQAEREFVRSQGPAAFEALLEAAQVDPIAMARPSAC